MISKEHLEKFKSIYKKRFGKDLSDQEALEKGTKLLRLVEIIYKPMTRKELKYLQERRKETSDLWGKQEAAGLARCFRLGRG